jgi:hypothetical protein
MIEFIQPDGAVDSGDCPSVKLNKIQDPGPPRPT